MKVAERELPDALLLAFGHLCSNSPLSVIIIRKKPQNSVEQTWEKKADAQEKKYDNFNTDICVLHI